MLAQAAIGDPACDGFWEGGVEGAQVMAGIRHLREGILPHQVSPPPIMSDGAGVAMWREPASLRLGGSTTPVDGMTVSKAVPSGRGSWASSETTMTELSNTVHMKNMRTMER